MIFSINLDYLFKSNSIQHRAEKYWIGTQLQLCHRQKQLKISEESSEHIVFDNNQMNRENYKKIIKAKKYYT